MRNYICISCKKEFTGNSLTGIFGNAFCTDKCKDKYYAEKYKKEKEELKR